MFKNFDEFIVERNIAKIQKNIKIKVVIDATVHSDERKRRHEGTVITDSDIVSTADKALPKITDELIFDKLDIGAFIHIYNPKNNLNLVTKLEGEGTNMKLVIITVMIKKDFKPKKGTKTVII